jgi:uncharacterized protein
MKKIIQLKLLPSEASDQSLILYYASSNIGQSADAISGFNIIKKSIDARAKQTWVLLTIQVFVNEQFEKTQFQPFVFKDVPKAAKSVIIVGSGPAGIFAALRLIGEGMRPIILERGMSIRARRRDLAVLNKEGIVNPESNYCFGEGGAGTYSDGKLYTRSSKRGNVERILELFVQFGADENILFDAHPHIGTNKLPDIITAMREKIIECGGVFHFEKKVVDLILKDGLVQYLETADGDKFYADAMILATGHSARDIFQLLHKKKILIEAKPFALGVRIEHPQQLINSIQYHGALINKDLPPASYSLVEQVNGKGVFSFCMCPGGIIAPAATADGELVVNGWSPSKRNNPFANSGIVVQVEAADIINNKQMNIREDALMMMHYQQFVEQNAFSAGGGKFVAPAQRMVDFAERKISRSIPPCSYLPGLRSVGLNEVLPNFIYEALQKAFVGFGKKIKGYYTNEAVVVATESRTSSPVRIPRDKNLLHHPQATNLYPCGEGAGYAGGIVSAAMDGERVANQIAQALLR